MLVNDNEYGAPWNDQFYEVAYEDDEEIITDTIVLSGPKHYTTDELKSQVYSNFGYVDIISIKEI